MRGSQVILKAGREGPVIGGHPWVFSGAVAAIEGSPQPGEVVRVRGADGRLVGCGTLSLRGAIAVRLFSRNDEAIDRGFVRNRLAAARELRDLTVPEDTTAYRLLNGEGDGLPGVVADWYNGWVVVQYLTAGADGLAPFVETALEDLYSPRGVYERSEGTVRRGDGLPDRCGPRFGEPPPGTIPIMEGGAHFLVDLCAGQKTGFFLDQRENRRIVRELARGRLVFDLFGYTGGFAVAAGLGDARGVISVDSSAPALELARSNWTHNGLATDRVEFLRADAFQFLRDVHDPASLIILDPPSFAKRRRDLSSALRGYREINRQAFLRLQKGGWLMTCSCSHHVSGDAFRSAVMNAAAEARRSVQLVTRLGPGADHPVAVAHPEGEYLKGYLVRALD
jgi:23S rRNA (cytosine1962-C5)-methyltransferase